MTTQMNQKQAADAIRNVEPFDASSLHGRTVKYFDYHGKRSVDAPSTISFARMAQAEWDTLRCYFNAGAVEYIVYSYATPIAYRTTSDGWVFCTKKHSVTTSRHVGIVKRAVAAEMESRALVIASNGTQW